MHYACTKRLNPCCARSIKQYLDAASPQKLSRDPIAVTTSHGPHAAHMLLGPAAHERYVTDHLPVISRCANPATWYPAHPISIGHAPSRCSRICRAAAAR